VVWNPGAEKARRLEDFGDNGYPGMVCVETANAGPDTVTLPSGAMHTLGVVIRVAPSDDTR
jgi:glucose-6-phosphate 1-epimerase